MMKASDSGSTTLVTNPKAHSYRLSMGDRNERTERGGFGRQPPRQASAGGGSVAKWSSMVNLFLSGVEHELSRGFAIHGLAKTCRDPYITLWLASYPQGWRHFSSP